MGETTTRWRKKPVEIEALNFLAYTLALDGAPLYTWLTEGGADFELRQEDPGPAYLAIHTLEGVMRADVGDWIIRGVKGEFYPCKPDIFEATYEPADAPSGTDTREALEGAHHAMQSVAGRLCLHARDVYSLMPVALRNDADVLSKACEPIRAALASSPSQDRETRERVLPELLQRIADAEPTEHSTCRSSWRRALDWVVVQINDLAAAPSQDTGEGERETQLRELASELECLAGGAGAASSFAATMEWAKGWVTTLTDLGFPPATQAPSSPAPSSSTGTMGENERHDEYSCGRAGGAARPGAAGAAGADPDGSGCGERGGGAQDGGGVDAGRGHRTEALAAGLTRSASPTGDREREGGDR